MIRIELNVVASLGGGGSVDTHNELPVLLLEPLVALSQLVGHQFELVSLLLTRVQLLGQDEQGLLLALQLALAHQELQTRHETIHSVPFAFSPGTAGTDTSSSFCGFC